MRQTLSLLKSGRALWYAPDQDYGRKHSVFAPFFGQPAATIRATSRLAKATGAKVLMLNVFRDPHRAHWTLTYDPVLADFPSGDDVADASRITTLETVIRSHPAQYLWCTAASRRALTANRQSTNPGASAQPWDYNAPLLQRAIMPGVLSVT